MVRASIGDWSQPFMSERLFSAARVRVAKAIEEEDDEEEELVLESVTPSPFWSPLNTIGRQSHTGTVDAVDTCDDQQEEDEGRPWLCHVHSNCWISSAKALYERIMATIWVWLTPY